MADKSFGVKKINLIGASGTPTIESPNNLNLNAITVAISTDVTIGGQVQSNLKIGSSYSVGIGTTNPEAKLHVVGGAYISDNLGIGTTNPTSKLYVVGDARVGINTSQGVILTSGNGTQYRLIVDNSGNLSTVSVT